MANTFVIAIAALLALSAPVYAQSQGADAATGGHHVKMKKHMDSNAAGSGSGDDACSNGDCRGINSSGNIGGHKDF